MYRAYGLLKPDHEFSLAEATRRLQAEFPRYTVSLRDDQQITVASDTWEIELRWNAGPEVAEESLHIAEKIGGEDAEDLASCQQRVEIWSETPDYEMEHFEDFQTVIAVLKTFPGVIPVNPEEPGLL